MSQQINLYEARIETSFWQCYAPFPQIALGLAMILMLVYLFAFWEYRDLRTELERVTAQQISEAQRLEELRQSMPQPGIDPKLEAEVNRLAARRQEKVLLLKALTQDRVGNDGGFSSYLEGLARRHVDGVWLTKIELTDGGIHLGLDGLTGRPEYVPQLIQNLAQEPVFEGAQFDIFSLAKTSEAQASMVFSVRAKSDKAQKQGEN